MTVDTTYAPATFTGDGSTVAYPLNHKVFQASHLSIKIDGSLTTAWSATGFGGSGVTVTFDTAPANGASIIIERIVPYTQDTDLENFDGNPSEVTEKQFDLLAMADQQIAEEGARAILTPIGVSITSNEVTGTIDSVDRVLSISTSGIVTSVTTAEIEAASPNAISAAASAAAASASETGAETARDEAVAAVGGVKVSTNDTTPGVLNGKLVAGSNITLVEGSDGGNETLTVNGDAGAWEPIQTQTISSAVASVDFTTGIDSSYKAYAIVLSHIRPSSDGSDLWLRTSTNTGVSFDSGASDYATTEISISGTSTFASVNDQAEAQIELAFGVGNALNESYSGIAYLFNPSDSTHYKQILTDGALFKSNGQLARYLSGGARLDTADIDAVQILMDSGNIAAGTLTLYGLAGA